MHLASWAGGSFIACISPVLLAEPTSCMLDGWHMDAVWMHGKQGYLASGIGGTLWVAAGESRQQEWRNKGNKDFTNRNGGTPLKNRPPQEIV